LCAGRRKSQANLGTAATTTVQASNNATVQATNVTSESARLRDALRDVKSDKILDANHPMIQAAGIGSASVHTALVRIIPEKFKDGDIFLECINAWRRLPKTSRRIFCRETQDALQAVIEGLEVHKNVRDIVLSVTSLLDFLTKDNRDLTNVRAFFTKSSLPRVAVDLMREHSNNTDILLNTMSIINWLGGCSKAYSSLIEFVNVGAIESIITTMQEFKNNYKIQHYGIRAIDSLCWDNKLSVETLTSVLEVVGVAMASDKRNKNIGALLHSDLFNHNCIEFLMSKGAHTTVFDVLMDPIKNSDYAGVYICGIYMIARLSTEFLKSSKYPLQELVVKGMKTVKNNSMLKAGFIALTAIEYRGIGLNLRLTNDHAQWMSHKIVSSFNNRKIHKASMYMARAIGARLAPDLVKDGLVSKIVAMLQDHNLHREDPSVKVLLTHVIFNCANGVRDVSKPFIEEAKAQKLHNILVNILRLDEDDDNDFVIDCCAAAMKISPFTPVLWSKLLKRVFPVIMNIVEPSTAQVAILSNLIGDIYRDKEGQDAASSPSICSYFAKMLDHPSTSVQDCAAYWASFHKNIYKDNRNEEIFKKVLNLVKENVDSGRVPSHTFLCFLTKWTRNDNGDHTSSIDNLLPEYIVKCLHLGKTADKPLPEGLYISAHNLILDVKDVAQRFVSDGVHSMTVENIKAVSTNDDQVLQVLPMFMALVSLHEKDPFNVKISSDVIPALMSCLDSLIDDKIPSTDKDLRWMCQVLTGMISTSNQHHDQLKDKANRLVQVALIHPKPKVQMCGQDLQEALQKHLADSQPSSVGNKRTTSSELDQSNSTLLKKQRRAQWCNSRIQEARARSSTIQERAAKSDGLCFYRCLLEKVHVSLGEFWKPDGNESYLQGDAVVETIDEYREFFANVVIPDLDNKASYLWSVLERLYLREDSETMDMWVQRVKSIVHNWANLMKTPSSQLADHRDRYASDFTVHATPYIVEKYMPPAKVCLNIYFEKPFFDGQGILHKRCEQYGDTTGDDKVTKIHLYYTGLHYNLLNIDE
jgi:hypothetical protein